MERIQDDIDETRKDLNMCQIAVARHDEQLKSIKDNIKRQNGLLESLNHGIERVVKTLDAFSLSTASRLNEIERKSIQRDTETEAGSIARNTNSNVTTSEDIDLLRTQFLTQHSKMESNLHWKIISAVSAIAFLFLLVTVTLLTHTFGSLP